MMAHRDAQARRREVLASRRAARRPVPPPPVVAPLGGCTRDTKRCTDAREYEHALRPCCRGHVKTITAHVVQALDAAGIPYWADYGTLLGAVRNPLTTWADYPWLEPGTEPIAPGIVPHDKDADIGIMHRYWVQTSRALRRVTAAHLYYTTERQQRSMKIRLSRDNHTNLDVFFWYEKPNGLLYRSGYSPVDAFKGKHFHKDLLLPLSTVEWEGMRLAAPRDPEAFLEMRYGESWRTPVMANHDGVKR